MGTAYLRTTAGKIPLCAVRHPQRRIQPIGHARTTGIRQHRADGSRAARSNIEP
ncbi:MAG: hypothetical protein ACOXZH_00140 [Bacteroidales bacterium]